jgi:hypothetical protein
MIPTFNGRIECRVPGLKLIDFYHSDHPIPTTVAQDKKENVDKHSSRIFKLRR